MTSPLGPGATLDSRFEILGLLREGGTSQVFLARDRETGGSVAIKVPLLRHEGDPAYFSRFAKEERIGRKLQHPSILRVIPVEQKKSRPYIVMERLEGKLLSELLKEGQPLPVDDALAMAARIARALEYLHSQGVIHRDVKPGNVMLCSDGSLRVIDLGLALDRIEPAGPSPAVAPPLGTPDYMPPEHVLGRPGDARSDIYSLGAMLYEMVTGRAPFQSPDLFSLMHARVVGDPASPSTFVPGLSPNVEEVILHAMERNPKDRYASMADFREDLEDPGRVATVRRAERLRPPSAWRIRWMRMESFVWTLLILLGGMGLLVLAAKWTSPRFRRP